MNEIVLKLKLITPMFLKADSPSNLSQPVLRSAPFRGEMRYWLRALTSSATVSQLKQVESNVFGSSQTGSVVSVSVKPNNLVASQSPMLPHRLISGSQNPLLSLGFKENQFITFSLRGRPGLKFSTDTILSLLLWLNLGGVGKRARRGFGSLQCHQVILDNAILPDSVDSLFEGGLPADGSALAARIKNLLDYLPNGPITARLNLPPATDFGYAPYPSFQNKCWAVVVGGQAFPNYTLAMQDFWNHLRSGALRDDMAYGSANPRHASPVHVHIAQSQTGYHIVLTAFFAEPKHLLNKDKLRDLLQNCGGTAYFI